MITRPATYRALLDGRAFHMCGGRVQPPPAGAWTPRFTCVGCGVSWHEATVRAWMAQDIELRFRVHIHPEADRWVLVYDVEPLTGRRFTRLVPEGMEGDRERARF